MRESIVTNLKKRTKEWLIFTVAVLFLLFMSIFFYSRFYVIKININNHKINAIPGVFVGSFLRDSGFSLKRGNKVDVNGKLLQTGKGGFPKIFVNSKSAKYITKLNENDIVNLVPAKDIRENAIKTKNSLAFGSAKEGKGPFLTVVDGKPGIQEVSLGGLSHKLISKRVLSKPVSKKYKRIKYEGKLRVVALTFDDGPSKYTWNILKILTHEKVPATFFVVGEQVKRHRQMMDFIVKYKFDIGNHSYFHSNLAKLSLTDAKKEIYDTNVEISKSGGKAEWARPPGGNFTDNLLDINSQYGMRTVLWTIDSLDWQKNGSEAIASRVVRNAYPGAVILLHDGGGNRGQTVKALSAIIKELRIRGYSFVRLEQLVGR